jgi:hypothetical protein
MSRLAEANPELKNRARSLAVAVTTLDAYCHQHQVDPDWLFVDIEGFEYQALQGAEKLMARRGQRLGIVVELHPSCWPSSATTRQLVQEWLQRHSRRPVPLQNQADPLGEYGIVSLEPV